jgi:hypothetical protein
MREFIPLNSRITISKVKSALDTSLRWHDRDENHWISTKEYDEIIGKHKKGFL